MSIRKRFAALALAVLMMIPMIGTLTAQAAPTFERLGIVEEADRGTMYETLLSLERLNKLGHIMHIGAHPDDEGSNGLFSYVHDSPRYQIEASYAVVNWGDGGNNEVGPELNEALGVIRSQELYSAAQFDKKTQYYVAMFDNGYTPSFETQTVDPVDGSKGGVWDPNVFVYNVARLIRLTRPDGIIDHHGDSGHAQHRSSNYFTMFGIAAAKDPNFKVYDYDGVTLLEPWEVKRMFRSGGTGGTIYTGRRNPFFQDDWLSYDSKGWNAPLAWKNPTYSAIGSAAYGYHITQSRTGQAGDGTINNTAVTNYQAIPQFSAAGMAEDGWQEAFPNKGTMMAGVDTSISRVNETLTGDNKTATDPAVARLKTALDNVVAKFPHSPNPVYWNLDKPEGAADIDETKTYIPEGEATLADVQAQIAAVSADMKDAAVALKELEAYAAMNADMAGGQTFTYFLELVRSHYDDFAARLYGIKQTVTLSDNEPSPGQTITVIAEIEGLASAFADEGAVVLPGQMLIDGLPTVIRVPSGSAVVSKTDAPVKETRTGKVFGSDMDVAVYRYEYDVTIPSEYKNYTGPYNAAYNEAYDNPSASYPYGTSDYVAEEWAWESRNDYDSLATIVPQDHTDDLVIDILTRVDDPYGKPRPVMGNTAILINGEAISVEVEPEVRLVPKLAVNLAAESKAVMLNRMDQAQTSPIVVNILNHMAVDANDILVTAEPMEADTGITVSTGTLSIAAKSAGTITLTATVPANYSGSPKILVTATYGGETFSEGYQVIDYTKENYDEHGTMQVAEIQYLYRESSQRLAVTAMSLPDDDIRIGFAACGTNDNIFPFIKAMYKDPAKAEQNCVIISGDDIAEGAEALRARFDTIIVGQEAFGMAGTARDLQLRATDGDNAKYLVDFTYLGGNLILSHQQQRELGVGNSEKIVPSNGSISFNPVNGPGNINFGFSPIYVNEDMATNAIYTMPNPIDLALTEPTEPTVGTTIPTGFKLSNSSIWDDWTGQRAEWCPTSIATVTAKGYVALFGGRDSTGQNIRPGTWGTAVEGGGNWTYTSIILSKHMDNLTPGVFQLMANLISMGYKGNPGWGNIEVSNQLDVSVSTPTLVESCAAYLNISVADDFGEDLTAYLVIDDEESHATPITNGAGRMYIEKDVLEVGTYTLVVKGDSAEGNCAIDVVAYNPDLLWKPVVSAGDDGKLLIRFGDVISTKNGVAVTIGAAKPAAAIVADTPILLVDIAYADVSGNIVVSGIKYAELFPSYSFTFTIAAE